MSSCYCIGPPGNCPCQQRQDLERKYKDIPVIPPRKRDFPPPDPNPVVAICGQCGLKIHQIMNYSCCNSRCPIQPQITMNVYPTAPTVTIQDTRNTSTVANVCTCHWRRSSSVPCPTCT